MLIPGPSFRLQAFLSLFAISCLYACAGKKESAKDLEWMEWSLNNSSKSIEVSTQTLLRSLEEKKYDPATLERATVWHAKAEEMIKLSREFYNYSDSIKSILNEEEGPGESFSDKMSDYKQAVLKIDTTIQLQFENSPEFSFPLKESITSNALTAVQSNIKVIENKIVAFCHMKVGSTGWDVFGYSPIVGQSSEQLKPGGTLIITAGIGAYS